MPVSKKPRGNPLDALVPRKLTDEESQAVIKKHFERCSL
jgi:hypothetical protein